MRVPRSVIVRLPGALACVALARAAVWMTSVRRTRRLLRRMTSLVGRRSAAAADLARAVRGAARLVPRASCLVQALALEALLARAGHDAVVRLGVSSGPVFDAHAWVECDGAILIGGSGADRYTPIAALDGATSAGRP